MGNYPSELEVVLELNAFGVPCGIDSIKDKKSGENIYDNLSPAERSAIASGADVVDFGLPGVAYELIKITPTAKVITPHSVLLTRSYQRIERL